MSHHCDSRQIHIYSEHAATLLVGFWDQQSPVVLPHALVLLAVGAHVDGGVGPGPVGLLGFAGAVGAGLVAGVVEFLEG